MNDIYRAQISDEMIAEMRRRIGQEVRGPEPYVQTATEDTIRNFAKGIGDYNPLWCDPEYAGRSRWGGIIAPPAMYYCLDHRSSGVGGGMPGVHGFFGGAQWKWHRPLFVNDRVRARAILKDLVEKRSSMGGRMFQRIGETTFYNQRDETVAVVETYGFRMERDAAHDRGKLKDVQLRHWSKEEIQEIFRLYREQEARRRGQEPRYWEDVQVGDEVGPIIRGPLTVSDIIVFLQGWGGQYIRSHGAAYAWFERHQAAGVPNELGIPEVAERVHWESDYARRVGVPGAYDYGPQRICWLTALMTDWMGDDAVLKQIEAQVRSFVLIGDLITCRGRVVEKSDVEGEHLVHCEIAALNQRDESTAFGTATVALPSRLHP